MGIDLKRWPIAVLLLGASAALVACGGGGGDSSQASAPTAPTPAASTSAQAPGPDPAALRRDVGELIGTATSVMLRFAVRTDVGFGGQRAGGLAPRAVRTLSLVCPAGGSAGLQYDSSGSSTVPAGATIRYTDCTLQGQHSGVPIAVTGTLTTRGAYTVESPDAPVVGETAAVPGGTLAIDGRVKGDGGYIGLVGGQSFEVGCVAIGCVFTGEPDSSPPPTPAPGVLRGTLTGTWGGTCGGETVDGTFTATLDGAGSVTGSFGGDDSGTITGSVDGTGNLRASGTAGLSVWSGTITRSGNTLSGNGTWSGQVEGINCSGGWQGAGAAQ